MMYGGQQQQGPQWTGEVVPERAQARAKEFDIPRACTVEELLADPEIERVAREPQTGKRAYGENCESVHATHLRTKGSQSTTGSGLSWSPTLIERAR